MKLNFTDYIVILFPYPFLLDILDAYKFTLRILIFFLLECLFQLKKKVKLKKYTKKITIYMVQKFVKFKKLCLQYISNPVVLSKGSLPSRMQSEIFCKHFSYNIPGI